MKGKKESFKVLASLTLFEINIIQYYCMDKNSKKISQNENIKWVANKYY